MIGSLILSAFMLIAIGLGYTYSRLPAVVGGLCVAMFLFGPRVPAAPYSTAGCVTAVALACAFWKVRPARFWAAATLAAVLPYVLAIPSMIDHYHEIKRLRAEYPVESLTERLAYEHKAPQVQTAEREPVVDPRRRESTVEYRFNRGINLWTGVKRTRSLQQLFSMHTEFASDFVRADGFGMVRMRPRIPARREYIELPEPEPIPVSPESDLSAGPLADSSPAEQPGEAVFTVQSDGQLADFHADEVFDFADPNGYGAIERLGLRREVNLERARGFQAHAFRQRPQPPERRGTTWKIEQLQLVSLLKHEAPAAYVSDNLPRMDELREAATRPLNEFEQSALEQLRSGEELVVHETRDAIQMLGALRAIHVCTDCHQVPQQTLLGAFSYRLRRPGVARTSKATL